MSEEVTIEGRNYISSKRASESSSYTQDYVGQLARAGLIDGRRIGGLWYVSHESLEAHKAQAEQYKPEPPVWCENRHKDMESFVALDGKDYISAGRASELSGYNKDYVGQLARNGQILARQVGNRWYVEKRSLLSHKDQKDELLATVQTESVGLAARGAESATDCREDAELMAYIPENGHLMPHFEPKKDDSSEATSRVASQPAHAVPIRIVRPDSSAYPIADMRQSVQPASRRSSGVARKATITGAICTIVVLISLGFSSIKSRSLYTLVHVPRAASLTAIASSELCAIGDVLEKWFAQEVVYHRTKK